MENSKPTIVGWGGIVGLLLLASSATLVIVKARGCAPGGDGVLAKVVTTTGVECVVVQSWNDWFEPYTVSFYFREGAGQWGWCYLDHQSTRWDACRMSVDETLQIVEVHSGDELRARFDYGRSEFSLVNEAGTVRRTVPAPQASSLRHPALLSGER